MLPRGEMNVMGSIDEYYELNIRLLCPKDRVHKKSSQFPQSRQIKPHLATMSVEGVSVCQSSIH